MTRRVEEIITLVFFLVGLTWVITMFSEVKIQNNPIIDVESSESNNISYSHSFDAELNQKFCGSPQCKFLFLYKVSEQESKAQKHFIQSVLLAQKLNRTLVLTNVGKSRLGSCFKYPFDYYYSTEYLQKFYPNLKLITQKQFFQWTKLRNKKPSSHNIIINENRQRKFHDFVEDQSNKYILKGNICSAEVDFDKVKYYNLSIGGRYWGNLRSLKELSNFILDSFKKLDDTEVLFINQRFHYPIFPDKAPHLEYAPHIINKAFTISQHLQPSIAVHWRMESGNPFNMPICAEKLVSSLEELKPIHNIKNVYFATDYPLNRSLAQSFTFREIKQRYHGKAIDILREKVDFVSWLDYTPTDQFGNKMHINEFALSGIPGIIDKIVCSRAKIFLIAPRECRKKSSSFMSMITSERRRLINTNVEGIENISSEW